MAPLALLMVALAVPGSAVALETVVRERTNAVVTTTCSSVQIAFRNFRNAPNNTVTEHIYVKGPPKGSPLELVLTKTFSFDGPSGTDVIPVSVPSGHSIVDALVNWTTNGFRGGFDEGAGLNCRTFMTGRAFGLFAETPLITVPPTPDTGPVVTPIASATTTPCVVSIPGAISAEALCANVTTHLAPATSRARASVANLSVAELIPLTPIAATVIEANSATTCAGASGKTKFASLTIGLTTFVDYEPPPNTTVELPLGLGEVVLNEQVPVPGASQGLTVNAIHIAVPSLGIDVIVSSAESDVERC
jgi:hypothetical protein